MLIVRERDVDGVDGLVINKARVVRVGAFRLEVPGSRNVSSSNGRKVRAGCVAKRLGGRCLNDPPCPQDAPANCHAVRCGVTGRPRFVADSSAASMTETTLRDCRGSTCMGVPSVR